MIQEHNKLVLLIGLLVQLTSVTYRHTETRTQSTDVTYRHVDKRAQ